MADIFDWDATPSNNTTVDGINIATGMPVQNVDNALRAILGTVRNSFDSGLESFLAGLAGLPLANGGTGATTAADARTNLGLGTSAVENTVPISKGGTGNTTAAAALLALMAGAVTGSAGAGTLNLGVFKLTWKDVTVSANGSTAVTYHSAFSSWSRAWCNSGSTNASEQDNNPFVVGLTETTSGCTVYNSLNGSLGVTVFAIGV